MLDRSQQRKVLELNVRCAGKKDGCQWVGELRHVVSHEREECDWVVMECSYQCGAHLPRRLMAEHEYDMCPRRPMDVKLESFMKRMEERHEKEMEKMETRLMTEREQHKREMKKLMMAESERYEREMDARLSIERERHDREMKKMETMIEIKLATESERNEKEMREKNEGKSRLWYTNACRVSCYQYA